MPLEPIIVSPNQRFLTTSSGQPFFWLGDTAWELFHRLNRAEAEYYFETRRQQGFNVIQAVLLGEPGGLHIPNANGHVPLLGDDPTRPNEFYFRYVDEVRRRKARQEETQERGNVREKRYKAPTLSRPGNRLGSVAWWVKA